ncbi:OsmC family protein [Rhodococcus sp. DT1]|uniref:OsmC family protein n=1 Tax=unclassified Rhodococcus (in: high G+C Gram-positive bacteria) TaxID=192944 RepID=UPI003CF87CCD
MLITHVHGYSARGMTIASLKLTVTAAVEDEGAALHDVQYLIEVDTDGPTESVSEVSQFVTCFSPNHRAFLDEGTFGLAIAVSGAAPDPIEIVWADEQTAGVRGTRRLVKAELVWEYGTETHITTMITPGGDKRLKMPTVIVDQSKQMLGIDRGPNPQELLLAAVSADLTHRIVSIAALRGMPVPNVTVEGSGRLDIRGMLNVSPDIPARFHNVEFVVRTDAGPDVSILADVVREAAEKNVILTALRRPNTVTVDVHTPSGRAISFESNAAQVAGCLEEIAQKPVVAAASDALDG